ncbi:helix-turn-helix transcriptional regulator [Micromonospora sp. NPDC003197]
MSPDRFFSLLLILQSNGPVTTVYLAEQLGVSVRTVLRDLDWLREAGFPLVVQRGRWGGVTLLPGSAIDATRLTPDDRDQLALSGLDAKQRKDLGVDRENQRAQQKLRSSARRTTTGELPLSAVVITDSKPWYAQRPGGVTPAALIDDLRRERRLKICYASSTDTQAKARWLDVDPYGLLVKAGTWYLVADHRGHPHLYRLDRITDWCASRSPRRLRPGADLATTATELVEQWEGSHSLKVDAELDPALLERAKRILGHRLTFRAAGRSNSGGLPITIFLRDLDGLRVLLPFGTAITVTAPDDAREHIRELAVQIADHYR